MPRKRLKPVEEVPLPTLTRREQQILRERMENPQMTATQRRRCTARKHGTGEQCKSPAIVGGYVCMVHGGRAPQVRKAALRRLQSFVDPALTRMDELSRQDQDLAVAFRASKDILDRANIAEERAAKAAANTRPTIVIGVKLGAMPESMVQAQLPPADPDELDAIEADLAEDGDDDPLA